MTLEIGVVLAVLVGAVVLFATEKIRVDVVSLMVLVTLVLAGVLKAEDAFLGFANPAVVTVWAIYMLSDGINRVGVADFIGERILKIAGTGEARLIGVLMITVGMMSAFTNNIGATAILLPAVVSIGHKADIPASKLLIPLSFGSMLGGVTTLIGTPPNLLVSNALAEAGLKPFTLLDYTPMGLIILVGGIVYMVIVGRHILPIREVANPSLSGHYNLRHYLTELRILADSPLVGKTLVETQIGQQHGLTVMGLIREDEPMRGILPDLQLHANDRLIVKSSVDRLMRVHKQLGVDFNPDNRLRLEDLTSEETVLAEVVLTQHARFVGKTVTETNFRTTFGLSILAIWHEEQPVSGSLANVSLQLGDVLLVYGQRERVQALRSNNQFLVLGPLNIESRRLHKAPWAVGIFVAMIALVILGWVHISMAAVMGVVLYILTGCITMDEAYRAVEWKSVFLIAGMLPLGLAMEQTGTAQFLADQIVAMVGNLGPRGVMVGLFVLTTFLTAFMSNAAAAVLVAPIAISIALNLGITPYAFVMSVGMAASNAFVTPVSHQSNILVYGPGGYRFFDYTKVGVPLMLLIWVLMLIFMPIFFPF